MCTSTNAATDAAFGAALTAESLIGLETSLWEAVRTRDITTFERLIADDAIYIDESGMATKTELLGMVPSVTLHDFELTDVQVTTVNTTSALVVYRCSERVAAGGKGGTTLVTKLASSLWQWRPAHAVVTFHQETLCRDAGGETE
jgi:hypothetical protein